MPDRSDFMRTKRLCMVAIAAAFMAVCAWITVPAPVPFTLQTFAVYLTVMTLGSKNGLYAMLVYVLLGAAGLPIFSGFRAGLSALTGPTGGYIIGFVLIPAAMLIFEKYGRKIRLASAAAALLVCYAFGTAWYAAVYMSSGKSIGIAAILITCVVPFILPDLLKIALAVIISDRIHVYKN